eukprot:20630-Heterococcus_DN1.PRE.4
MFTNTSEPAREWQWHSSSAYYSKAVNMMIYSTSRQASYYDRDLLRQQHVALTKRTVPLCCLQVLRLACESACWYLHMQWPQSKLISLLYSKSAVMLHAVHTAAAMTVSAELVQTLQCAIHLVINKKLPNVKTRLYTVLTMIVSTLDSCFHLFELHWCGPDPAIVHYTKRSISVDIHHGLVVNMLAVTTWCASACSPNIEQ